MTNGGGVLTPLRKWGLDGKLYERDPVVETRIAALSKLTDPDLIRACSLPQTDTNFVRPECVLYLLRRAYGRKAVALSEQLHKNLVMRLLKRMPRPESADGTTASAHNIRVRDYVLDRFMNLLASDAQAYEERLDFYEVRFGAAVARLRDSAERDVTRKERRAKPLLDEETGDVLAVVEEAAGTSDPFKIATKYATDYRSELDAAIDRLLPEQREILEMLFHKRMLIESKDPSVPSIVQITGLAEKTVRNRRDRALAELHRLLTQEDAS
jgi:DNA-directed RNA polymerase specialized sigma24 family protein